MAEGKTATSTAMRVRVWLARALVFIVFAINLYCIFVFIVFPENHIRAYELTGVAGIAAIQGIGVAFLMWNVTYPLVIVSPGKFRILFLIVIIQQIVGLLGESYILFSLPEGYPVLHGNILRFIAFDAGGLVLLVTGFFLSRTGRGKRKAQNSQDQQTDTVGSRIEEE